MIEVNNDDRCCQNCRFHFDGECRRFPPQIWSEPQSEYSSSYRCNFPEVGNNQWCGEFEEIEKWVVPTGTTII